jgi:hypothetical protein
MIVTGTSDVMISVTGVPEAVVIEVMIRVLMEMLV